MSYWREDNYKEDCRRVLKSVSWPIRDVDFWKLGFRVFVVL